MLRRVSLRLDVPREQALERAAEIVAAGLAQLRPGARGRAADRRPAQGAARGGAAGVADRGARGARGRTARARRVDRPDASALLRVRRLVGPRDRRHRRSPRLVLRREPRGVGGRGHRDRGSGRPLGGRVRRVPGCGRGVHERGHGLQHDGARGGPGAGDPRLAPSRARRRHRDALLLGRGALLDRASGRDPRDRLRQRAVAADRREPPARARGGGGGDPGRPRRRPCAGRSRRHRGHDADGRRRPDRRARRRLRRGRRLAARRRRLRAPCRDDPVGRPPLRRPRPGRLGDARRPQVALPAQGVRRPPRPPPRGPLPGVLARGGVHPARAARATWSTSRSSTPARSGP